MRKDDIPAARELSHAALELLRSGNQAPAPSSPGGGGDDRALRDARWERRAAFFLEHDPDGCWVAADELGDVVGVAMALRRENLWGLSAFFVRPDRQGAGIGSALLEAVLRYSEGCLRGIIISTEDPRAARRYRLAGFTLHPTMRISGEVDRSTLPVVEAIRVGDLSDRDLCDSVDRQVRGAAHGVDHEFLNGEHGLLVADTFTGSGYCYVDESGSPVLLAATNRKLAQRLLWSAIAASPVGAQVRLNYLTAAQEWAVDVALAAGLSIRNQGYLALRHMRPPSPYLPSGAFL
jgi:GNAT superfamily N-acetyltransferase